MNILDKFWEYWNVLYLGLVAILLFLSYFFIKRAIYDERRFTRYRRKYIKRQLGILSKHLVVPEYDRFFKQNKMPTWINSERLNFFRLSVMGTVIFIVILQSLLNNHYFSYITLGAVFLIALTLIPKKPFPLYYLILAIRRKYYQDLSDEIYQLYNEIKSHYYNRGNSNLSTYFIIQQSIPYYKKLKPTLEKMLPYLEEDKHSEAWELFEYELNIKEAVLLRIVMEEIESLNVDQALELLEEKKEEIKNSLYNRYEDYLFRRKEFIHVVVYLAALSVFFNECAIFFLWYRDTMSLIA